MSNGSTKLSRFLDFIERAGNKLPDPLTLFFMLSLLAVLFSAFFSWMDITAVSPVDQSVIKVTNLLTYSGVQKMLTEMVKNFANFPPFAVVLVCMLGIGVADKSGLFSAALKKLVTFVPSSLLPATLVFAGIMSNIASDAGYIVLTPLGAVLFAAFGRHPIAGLTAAFAGVSGGFSANLFLSSLDPMLGGLSTKAAQLMDPNYNVLATANYYFMFASTFVITAIGTFVTVKIVEPRLGKWSAIDGVSNQVEAMSAGEKKGLLHAALFSVVFAAFLMFATIPEGAILRDETGELKPFFNSIVPLIMIYFMVAGILFGVQAKTIRSDRDVNKMLTESMSALAPYIVLAFISAQFVAFFSWSNIGIIVAIKGATVLKSIGLTGLPLFFCFITVTAFLNLFMGSASAKWAIMAPVFVPMFMMMGYSPELVQNSYRVGDSVTNIISPLLPYFPIIVAFGRKYKPDLGIGTLISLMLPYSFAFYVGWTLLFAIWFGLELPIGPNAPLYWKMGQ
jgi:aminobenzoyl-glutamate transport protein